MRSPFRDESFPVGPEFLREPLLSGPECAAHQVPIHGRTQNVQQLRAVTAHWKRGNTSQRLQSRRFKQGRQVFKLGLIGWI